MTIAHWCDAVADGVRRTADACRDGRARGQQLSDDRKPETASTSTTASWLLRHPSDHYFSKALEVVSDPLLHTALSEWVAAVDPSYSALATRDWSIEQSRTDLLAEARVTDAPPTNWTEPAVAMVLNSYRGSIAPGSKLALRQVADPIAAFNGKLFAMLSGERWLVCGDRLGDGSILVCDGTRRIQKAD